MLARSVGKRSACRLFVVALTEAKPKNGPGGNNMAITLNDATKANDELLWQQR